LWLSLPQRLRAAMVNRPSLDALSEMKMRGAAFRFEAAANAFRHRDTAALLCLCRMRASNFMRLAKGSLNYLPYVGGGQGFSRSWPKSAHDFLLYCHASARFSASARVWRFWC